MCQQEEGDDEEEKKMQQWCINAVAIYLVKSWKRRHDMSVQSQYPWQRAEKEEKKVWPNLYAMHAKHVITIPKDIQLTATPADTATDETIIIITDDDIKG